MSTVIKPAFPSVGTSQETDSGIKGLVRKRLSDGREVIEFPPGKREPSHHRIESVPNHTCKFSHRGKPIPQALHLEGIGTVRTLDVSILLDTTQSAIADACAAIEYQVKDLCPYLLLLLWLYQKCPATTKMVMTEPVSQEPVRLESLQRKLALVIDVREMAILLQRAKRPKCRIAMKASRQLLFWVLELGGEVVKKECLSFASVHLTPPSASTEASG